MVTRSGCCECLTCPIYFTSQTPRTEWVLKWPGQIVIAGCQTHWTKEVSEALVENKINELYKALMAQVPTTVVEMQSSLPTTPQIKGRGIGLVLPLLHATPTTKFSLDRKRWSCKRNQKNQKAFFTRT